MTTNAALLSATDSLSIGGVRGLITVFGTLAFVALCFGLVEFLDRRTTEHHGAATGSFQEQTPAPDTHIGETLARRTGTGRDRASLDQSLITAAFGAVGAVLVAAALNPLSESIDQASVALALVLVVTAAAAAGGRIAAASTSAVAALSFNFLHAPPLYSFHIRGTADVVTSVLMVVVGVAVGEVAVRRFRTVSRGDSAQERSN